MNSPSEFPDRKRCIEEANPELLPSPDQKKNKRRKKNKVALPKEPIVEKGAGPNGANLEHPQLCPKFEPAPVVDLAIPTVKEREKGVESNELTLENPIGPKANTPKKKKWEKKTKSLINCQGEEWKKPGSPRPVGVEEKGACFESEPATPVDRAIPRELDNEKGIGLNEATSENPIAVAPVKCILHFNQTIPTDPAAPVGLKRRTRADEISEIKWNPGKSAVNQTVPIDPAIPVNPEQKMTNKKRKRKSKSALKSNGVEPSKHNAEQSDTPVQRSTCPIAVSPVKCILHINQTIPTDPAAPVDLKRRMCEDEMIETEWNPGKSAVNQTVPIDPAIPINPEQKMTNKKRKRKSKSSLKNNGVEPIKHNAEQSDTPVQRSTCPIAVSPVKCILHFNQTIPTDPAAPVDLKRRMCENEMIETKWNPGKSTVNQTVPIDPAIPINPEQKMTNKKRRRKSKSARKSKGVEPSKHNAEQSDTLVQRSTCPIAVAPVKCILPINQTIPTDTAARVDPKQKKTKKKKKRKSDLKSEGAEPYQFNLYTRDGKKLMGCQECQMPGHKYLQCPKRKKHLTWNQDICFFCGEIGHSLGTCSVSRAGGGRFFAKCLFCYELGHLSNNCPGNGCSIDPKVVAANGPISTTVGAEGKSIAEVINM